MTEKGRVTAERGSTVRSSNLELLRIFCILAIISDHFVGQSGVVEGTTLGLCFFYCALNSLSRVGASVFIIISAWFSVDKPFRMKKIVHVWLTVAMYTIPMTLFLYLGGIATRENLMPAFLPIEESPLWFAGYYMVLRLLSPIFNIFLNKAPKQLIEIFCFGIFLLQVLYPTVTNRAGFFASDMWIFIFLYIFTGYMKKYGKEKPKPAGCFAAFACIWCVLTGVRAVAQTYWYVNPHVMQCLAAYGEQYRARLSTLPNIIMAYTVFWGFYGIQMKNNQIINRLASAALGVYCAHQVPVWYTYLWEHIFHASWFCERYAGRQRALYTVCCILLVWVMGTMIELCRSKFAEIFIENQEKVTAFCNAFDEIANGQCELKKHKKKLLGITIVAAVYFLILELLF